MFCQVCQAHNPDEQEYCSGCQQKLLVLSGAAAAEEEATPFDEESTAEGLSLDEHLLERVSLLEEAVKRTAETVRRLLIALNKQERNIIINQSGLASLREVLEGRRLISAGEWGDLWEAKMNYQLLAVEKRERFLDLKERLVADFRGEKRAAFEDLLDDGESALFAYDIQRALEALESAFKLDRRHHELAYFIGETHFNEGDAEQALAYFSRVLEEAPDHHEGLVYSGVIHYERGERGRATKLLERAAARHPESFLANFSLGAVYDGERQLARAESQLERAVEIDPVPQALYLLAGCLYEQGKLGPAIRRLRQVVRQDPGHEEAYNLLGLAYLDRHWNRKALEAFRQAQQLNPKKLRYQDLVGYLSGQTDSPLPEVGGPASKWLGEAEDHLARDKTERALVCYRRAVEADPDNPTLLMSYALACLQHNRARESEKVARKVLDLEPGEMLKATAYATVIESLRCEGRYQEGNRVGRRLLDEGASDFARTIAYYEMAYNMAEMEEDLDRALDYAQQSLDLAPEELRQFPLAAMGWVHYKRREFDQAVEFLALSSELGSSATTLTHLGMALLASGSEQRAREILAQARAMENKGVSVEQKMMECLRASDRLYERVQTRRKKQSGRPRSRSHR
jgi:tetratricopeptide (TPR) repeat protein